VSFLPRPLVHNWRLKLAALGLAVFLWALVQTEPRNAETFSAIPVRVEVADTLWTLSGQPNPSSVDLRLSGPAREIIRLAREGTMVRVNIREVGSSDTLVTLRRDWVELGDGRGISVESVSPSAVHLSFERAMSRTVPLTLRFKGQLPDRWARASPWGLNPQVARVRGPASRVKGVDSLPLEPLDLSRIRSSGVFEVAVDTAGLGGGRVTPPTATLAVRVEEKVERVLTGIPVIIQPADGEPEMSVEPASVAVTLQGARTLVNAVVPADLQAWVASELVHGLVVGEERRVHVRIEGVPDLVSARADSEVVTVRRVPQARDQKPEVDG
jgi:YbbR domain-containing protein